MSIDIHLKGSKIVVAPSSSSPDATTADAAGKPDDFVVTPWEVEGKVDYEKVIRDFGSERISADVIARLERLTKRKAHHFIRRGIFFSHRDLNMILDMYENGKPFYLYTGRGPSSESMHFGHLVPFHFTKWLQDAFDVPLVIQMTDDEKFLWKDISQEKMDQITNENIKDIIALGFKPEKTFIFKNYEYLGNMYRVISRIQRAITASQARGCFGFRMEDNIGKWSFPAIQAAPSFSDAFPHIFPQGKNIPCLIPCAIDQDPYFRLTRDIAPRIGWLKPALIHSSFFPSLLGPETKMSASVETSCIYLTDTDAQIKDKVSRNAFSGGGATKGEHWSRGGNVDIDVPLQWLSFFLEDDARLEELRWGYATGRIMSGEVKQTLIALLQGIVKKHKEERAKVTMDTIKAFTTVRDMSAAAQVRK
eukprot:PhF_6_TR24837/c0_g1_i2/m.34253/K01867/WARS, trpS; tryptophanyl-tRNA synthetase